MIVMDTNLNSRRHFICAGAIGLSTSLAGCVFNQSEDPAKYDPDYDRENPDYEPDGPTNEYPGEPPVLFNTSKRGKFDHQDLFLFLPDKDLPLDAPDIGGIIEHEDNSIVRIEILDADTAKATFTNTDVRRDTKLYLRIRDADNNWEKVEAILFSTPENAYDTHEVKFDISEVNLPTSTGGICILTGNDTHASDASEMSYKIHQFVGIPYNNGIKWMNSENFNYTRWRTETGIARKEAPKGVNGSKVEEPAGLVDDIDTDDERIVFLASRTNTTEEVIGVSAHIDHKPARDYKNGSERHQYRYGIKYEAHYATDISHFQELAEKTASVIDALGITDKRRRLEALGDLIQTIPYLRQGNDPSPTVVAYDMAGDCSSKSILMSCILQNDPWNMMPAFLDSEIQGVGHWTIGINVDDLGNADTSNMFTIESDESDLDAEYAFFDMTIDSYIGRKTPGIEQEEFFDLGDFTYYPGRRANDPPNY
ncbi:hypothetical protein HYG81_22495 (plasmid) [Natrinema zhouii]|uniref:hypothetical protein n=1 Tax=Natrinema zhouii TaxID=1710539 RepID=UPI001CFFFE95|nr:hypothetical protein [Natrinema zhouii]UHQ98732.1 hypothetical protein HYG81_22495 [Natrinema zhouii]